MAEGNGNTPNWEARMTRMEEIAAALLEHARVTDEHQDRQDRRIEELGYRIAETNGVVRELTTQMQSFLGALRELIDRTPPANLQ
jgi:uncharacterized coiled-coil protein SlyX